MASRKFSMLAGFFALLMMYYVALKIQEYGYLLGKKDTFRIPNIVFLETSGRTFLKAREGCALESAALHNPERMIHHYSTGRIGSDDIYRMTLKTFSNVRFEPIDTNALFTDTPLYTWYKHGTINTSSFPIQHMSDAIRLAILWKNGGIYLDTDMISVRSLGDMFNSLGFTFERATNSAMAFQRQHPFLVDCMQLFTTNYLPQLYANHGPVLVTKVLRKFCKIDDLHKVINAPSVCGGITLLPEISFCAFPFNKWQTLFKKGDKIDTSLSYTVHMYSKMSENSKAKPGDGSLIDIISKNNCPSIYQMMIAKNEL